MAPGSKGARVVKGRKKKSVRSKLPAVALLASVLLIWEFGLRAANVEPFIFPTPTAVADSLVHNASELADHAAVTGWEIVLGFTIAAIAGVLIALALHLSRPLKDAAYPLLVASQAIPLVVISPVLVLLMGFGIGPKLVIVALTCFFPVVVTTLDGLASTDPTMRQMMTTLYGNRWDILWRVEIPSALPSFFTGLRIGATYCAIGAIVAEWSGATAGLGFFIQQRASSLDTPDVIAAIVVICLITFVLLGVLTWIERRTIPWAHRGKR
jgi:putative hydroxymethylpyrimidine transport system permease protein